MKISCYTRPSADHQIDTANKFISGLKHHGNFGTVSHPCRADYTSDLILAWGLRNCKRVRGTSNKDFLIMERAYLGDRFNWVSLGYNDLNNRADFLNQDMPSDRWNKYWKDLKKDWKLEGDHILLTLQVRGDNSLNHVKVDYQKIINDIRKYTDRPILIRDHPHRKNTWGASLTGKNVKYANCNIPVEKAVSDARVVVTINSNSGVDAIMQGTPVINFDYGSMVWDVAVQNDLSKIENPDMPDVTQWCYNIAYTQWLPEEIESGEAWNHLKNKYN